MTAKKVSSLLTLFALSTSSAFAFGGFHIGGDVGGALLQGTHKYTNATSKEGKQAVNAFGYLAGAHVGYFNQIHESRLALGAQIYGMLAGPNAKKDLQIEGGAIEGKVNIRHKYAIGAALVGGMVINPRIFIYAKVGYELSKFELQYKDLTFQTPNSEKYTKSVRGIVPGAGVYYKLSSKIIVGGEYSYASLSKIAPRKDSTVINGASRGYSYKPIEHRLVAKISYLF